MTMASAVYLGLGLLLLLSPLGREEMARRTQLARILRISSYIPEWRIAAYRAGLSLALVLAWPIALGALWPEWRREVARERALAAEQAAELGAPDFGDADLHACEHCGFLHRVSSSASMLAEESELDLVGAAEDRSVEGREDAAESLRRGDRPVATDRSTGLRILIKDGTGACWSVEAGELFAGMRQLGWRWDQFGHLEAPPCDTDPTGAGSPFEQLRRAVTMLEHADEAESAAAVGRFMSRNGCLERREGWWRLSFKLAELERHGFFSPLDEQPLASPPSLSGDHICILSDGEHPF